MPSFDNIQLPSGLSASQERRINQRRLMPTAVKSRMISQDVIKNTDVVVTTFSIGNGVTISLNVRSSNTTDPELRVSAVPMLITFYEADGLSAVNPGTNGIPFDVATGRYDIYGPFAMPEYTVNEKRVTSSGTYFATDGNDLVWRTSIANNSGSQQTITALIQLRTIQVRGGGA